MSKLTPNQVAWNRAFQRQRIALKFISDLAELFVEANEPECKYDTTRVAEKEAELIESFLPILRAHLVTLPGAPAFLKAEAEVKAQEAELDAERLARAKAAGFESVEAQRAAERQERAAADHVRRSQAAKKAAATRQRRRTLSKLRAVA